MQEHEPPACALFAVHFTLRSARTIMNYDERPIKLNIVLKK